MTYRKMNPEVKAKWLSALRGGKYKQAQKVLEKRKNGKIVGQCCLGVFLRCNGVEPHEIHHDHSCFRTGSHSGIKFSSALPLIYGQKFGISNQKQNILIYMNDILGADFPTIASWVEKNL